MLPIPLHFLSRPAHFGLFRITLAESVYGYKDRLMLGSFVEGVTVPATGSQSTIISRSLLHKFSAQNRIEQESVEDSGC